MVKLIENQVESHKEFEMIKITDEVKKAVEESGIKNGMVAVITKHTTTGIMINEALPCVEKDIEMELERLVPHDYIHSFRFAQAQNVMKIFSLSLFFFIILLVGNSVYYKSRGGEWAVRHAG